MGHNFDRIDDERYIRLLLVSMVGGLEAFAEVLVYSIRTVHRLPIFGEEGVYRAQIPEVLIEP